MMSSIFWFDFVNSPHRCTNCPSRWGNVNCKTYPPSDVILSYSWSQQIKEQLRTHIAKVLQKKRRKSVSSLPRNCSLCIREHTYIWNALEFRSHYLWVYCLSEYVYSLLYRVSIKTSGRTGSTFPDIAHGENSIQSVIDICCKSKICSCFRIKIFEKNPNTLGVEDDAHGVVGVRLFLARHGIDRSEALVTPLFMVQIMVIAFALSSQRRWGSWCDQHHCKN